MYETKYRDHIFTTVPSLAPVDPSQTVIEKIGFWNVETNKIHYFGQMLNGKNQ